MQSELRILANEIQLVVRAQCEPLAFAHLYDHYFPHVYKYVLYRVRDPHLADDLTALTFERALRDLRDYDVQRGDFAAWLFGITRNVINQHFRRHKRFQWLPLDWLRSQPSSEPDPEEAASRQETSDQLLDALAQLTDRERDLLALKFAAGLTNRQIAALTGLNASHVGVIVYRAVQRLRTILSVEDNHV